jgi:protein-arginine kinase activator protein McsA
MSDPEFVKMVAQNPAARSALLEVLQVGLSVSVANEEYESACQYRDLIQHLKLKYDSKKQNQASMDVGAN